MDRLVLIMDRLVMELHMVEKKGLAEDTKLAANIARNTESRENTESHENKPRASWLQHCLFC
jgi:hypothetical protein